MTVCVQEHRVLGVALSGRGLVASAAADEVQRGGRSESAAGLLVGGAV